MKQIKSAKVLVEGVNGQNNFRYSIWQANKKHLFGLTILVAFLLLSPIFILAQYESSNVKSTAGKVNENTIVSFGVPITNYKGRGMDLPVSLSYSSTVWNIEHKGIVRNYSVPGYSGYYFKQSVTEAIYAKNSTAGWKSSLDLPTIEIPTDIYNSYGGTGIAIGSCPGPYRIARLYVHMPDGSTHELRINDTPYTSGTPTGTFYAVDDSRLRFDGGGSDLSLIPV